MPHGIFKVGEGDYRLFRTTMNGEPVGESLARRSDETTALALLPAMKAALKADLDVPREWVAAICPDCARKMEDRGWKTLRIREGKSAATDLLEGLCQVTTPSGALSWYVEARIAGDLSPEDQASWDSFEMWLLHYCAQPLGDSYMSDEPATGQKGIRDFISKSVPQFKFETKEDQDPRVKTQVFSVMGHVDSVDDRINLGAFRKTLQENRRRLRVLWQHDMKSPPVGVPVTVAEKTISELPADAAEFYRSEFPDATGVLVADVKYLNTERGNEVLEGITNDALNENSIGFSLVQGKMGFSVEGGVKIRELFEVQLWDISPVLWGANDATTNIKRIGPLQYDGDELDHQLQRLEPVLRDLKAGRVLSEANLGRLKSALELLSEILDTAEPLDSDGAEKSNVPTLTDEWDTAVEQADALLRLAELETFISSEV